MELNSNHEDNAKNGSKIRFNSKKTNKQNRLIDNCPRIPDK